MFLLLASILVQEVFRVEVQPWDFQSGGNPETFIHGTNQLETDGIDLFILPSRVPKIIQIKTDGTYVRTIGREGEGPGELGSYPPKATAVSPAGIWVLTSRAKHANLYIDGKFAHDLRLRNYMFRGSGLPAYAFAFNQDYVVIQAHPTTGSLANAYNYDGTIHKKVSRILPIEPEFLKRNPAINGTIWRYDDGRWYCLFVHRPIIRVFGADFEMEKEFILNGPEIEVYEEIFFKNEPDPNWTYPKPHFTDFKVAGNSLLVLCDGMLYQVEKSTGEVLSRTHFNGDAEIRKRMSGDRLHFIYFAQVDDRLFLASTSAIYDHDLWTVKVPFKGTSNP